MTLKRELAEQLVAKHGSPLLLVDCLRLKQQVENLSSALPGVDLFYAVKALPNQTVINQLNQMGVGFDIASTGEIDLLRKEHINPRNAIHTHPIKKDRDIRDALRFGCTTFVIDNLQELKKFRAYRQRVGLLLRISFRSPDAIVDLSKKFGCLLEDVDHILKKAADLGIRIKGFSFHVGSQGMKSDTHVYAIEQCAQLIHAYQEQYPHLSVLDIGGGFPVSYSLDEDVDIDAFCAPIRVALANVPANVRVMAEPGRYLVAPVATGISSVVGKTDRGGQCWYYLDDGIYGNYSGQLFDGVKYPISVFVEGTSELRPCVLAGPTCDSIDVIAEDILLPNLEIGDLVIGHVMGAYTHATATNFNSLNPTQVICINQVSTESAVAYIA